MLQRIASLLAVPLAAACAQTPMNVSGSTVVLGPGHVLEGQVTPAAGADLRRRAYRLTSVFGPAPGGVLAAGASWHGGLLRCGLAAERRVPSTRRAVLRQSLHRTATAPKSSR